MIGDMLILSEALTLFILLGIVGKWRVERDSKVERDAKTPNRKAETSADFLSIDVA